MTDTWTKTIPIAQLAEGSMQEVQCAGKLLCLYNLEGQVYATDARCTHGEANLVDGYIIGQEIECPFHQGLFDIPTGKATGSPCTVDLATYPVRVRDGDIDVQVEV